MKKTHGITLIALIITIIMMLILVSVSVNIVLKTGLFKSAGDAIKNWKSEQDAESSMSEITIDGKTYASVEDYINGKEKMPEGAGTRYDKTEKYTDGTQTATIPAGFTVSGIGSETTIDGGLVIYDIPEGIEVDWNNPDSVKTKYNQFVWIPVTVSNTDTETSIANFYRSEWIENSRGTSLMDSVEFIEPGINDAEDETGIATQIANLTKSIYNNGGFYIGRYEAGSEEERICTNWIKPSQTDSFVIQQDKYPYYCIKWGTSVENINSGGAVYLSNRLYNNDNYGAISMLCTGAAWDSMLNFIKDETHNVTNGWGNQSDAEFNVIRGKYAICDNNDPYNIEFVNVGKEGYKKTKDTNIILTTGALEQDNVKNIYDVGGNCEEWTTEIWKIEDDQAPIYRSGSFDISTQGASNRTGQVADNYGKHNSFRPILYIK